MTPLADGAQLQQFVFAASWMRSALPNFTAMIAVLQNALETVYARLLRRTKRAAASVELQNGI